MKTVSIKDSGDFNLAKFFHKIIIFGFNKVHFTLERATEAALVEVPSDPILLTFFERAESIS